MTVLLDAEGTRAALPWSALIAALREMFQDGCETPVRHHHHFHIPGEEDGTLLLMPAWRSGAYLGVKMLAVVPGNSARGLPAIAGAYLLSSAVTGAPLALIDGAELTARRTAATSALAASYLARKEAESLLVVGAGRLSLNLIEAHTEVRPIRDIAIWARRPDQAEEVAAEARARGYSVRAVTDLEASVRQFDIVSCCTLSRMPLVLGAWLQPGSHLDLIGAFKPEMRESDDAAIAGGLLYADTREGVMSEAGDVLQPIRSGAITEAHIQGDLFDLCRSEATFERKDEDCTVFKSVGASLEDLAAAMLVLK